MADYPPPRFGTPRNPANPTQGRRLAHVAALMGTPLLPWQRYVADVTLEQRPADIAAAHAAQQAARLDYLAAKDAGDFEQAALAIGRLQRARIPWAYPLVVILVPRQSGKTVLMRTAAADRLLSAPNMRALMTAQLGKHAVARWADLVESCAHNPTLKKTMDVHRSQGSECLTFPNASFAKPFPPSKASGHGDSVPFVSIDEAWYFDAVQGAALDAAVRGAQLTRADRQTWIISAAGTAESEYLLELRERGRREYDNPNAGIAYFEWSLPDDADLSDPAAADYHPAIGHLISRARWDEERRDLPPGVFARNMANQWTKSLETVFDLDLFQPFDDSITPPDDVAIGFDVAADRSESAIVAAWKDNNGVAYWQVIKSATGYRWLASALKEISTTIQHATIGADNSGAVKAVIDEIKDTIELDLLGAGDFGTATTEVLSLIENKTDDTPAPLLVHDDDPAWAEEAAAATLRRLGQTYAWDRHNSRAPIPRLIAGTVALRLYDHGAPQLPPPTIRFY